MAVEGNYAGSGCCRIYAVDDISKSVAIVSIAVWLINYSNIVPHSKAKRKPRKTRACSHNY